MRALHITIREDDALAHLRRAVGRLVRRAVGWIPVGRPQRIRVVDTLTVTEGSAVKESMGAVSVGFQIGGAHDVLRVPRLGDRWTSPAALPGHTLGAAAARMGLPRSYQGRAGQ